MKSLRNFVSSFSAVLHLADVGLGHLVQVGHAGLGAPHGAAAAARGPQPLGRRRGRGHRHHGGRAGQHRARPPETRGRAGVHFTLLSKDLLKYATDIYVYSYLPGCAPPPSPGSRSRRSSGGSQTACRTAAECWPLDSVSSRRA